MRYAYSEAASSGRGEKVYDLFPHEAWRIDRGPKRIVHLLVVDENKYDVFLHEGKGIDRG